METEEAEKVPEKLIDEKARLQKLVEMAEPFEMLIENDDYKKILGFYAKSSEYYQNKIMALCNDLANDNDETETTVNRHYRIADVISRAVVARDTLANVASEPKSIIANAREAQKRIEEINTKIQEDLTHAG